ncbi:MAG: PAS domain-containing sensor histidine kinase [Fimbriimonas sp.]
MSVAREPAMDGELGIGQIPVPARIVDVATLRYLAVNDANCRLYGFSEAEFLQMTALDIVVPEEHALVAGYIRSCGDIPKSFGRLRQRRKDGSTVIVETVARRVNYDGREAVLALHIDRTEEHRSQQEHAETERRMVAVVEGMRDAFVLLDADFRIRYANRNCFPILQSSPAEIEETPFWEAFPGVGETWYASLFVKVMRDRIPLHFEVAEPFGPYALDVFPVEDGIGITMRDVRDAHREEARQRFLIELGDHIRTLESPEDILWAVVTSVGEFFQVGRTTYGEIDEAEEHVYVDRDYVRGVIPIPGRHRLNDFSPTIIAQLRSGRTVIVEDTHTDARTREHASSYDTIEARSLVCVPLVKSGRFVALFVVHHPAPRSWDPADVGLLEGVADRTWHAAEHARAQQEVRRLNQVLEARVDERTAELQAAKDDMEGFCYSVSHDLRTPLRAMMASAMILIEDHGERLDEDGQMQLRRLGNAARRMGDLIDDLLQFSRLGRKEITRREVDLSVIAASLCAELADRHRERRIEYVVEPGLRAHADEQLLRLVLQNLLDNATKFTARREVARIEFGRGGDGFFVRDNGVGFDPLYTHKLFRPFERLHRDDEYPGTGIGLANVKRIVERHHGKVFAESDPGAGTTFWFTLGE